MLPDLPSTVARLEERLNIEAARLKDTSDMLRDCLAAVDSLAHRIQALEIGQQSTDSRWERVGDVVWKIGSGVAIAWLVIQFGLHH